MNDLITNHLQEKKGYDNYFGEGRYCDTHNGGFWGRQFKRCGWHSQAPELECKPVMEERI